MKHVYLSGKLGVGRSFVVDDNDYHLFDGITLYLHNSGYAYYKVTNSKSNTAHRLIMNPPDGVYVDHVNGDRLDNRRSNLRLASKQQNNINRGATRNNKLGYKGVVKDTRLKNKPYFAYIKDGGTRVTLGGFAAAEEAALAYDAAAIQLHGEFAHTNILKG